MLTLVDEDFVTSIALKPLKYADKNHRQTTQL